jgi:polyphosphate kinase
MEAADETVPLYQRIKFIAIYSSNLDEFFRVRVAVWRRISALKKKKLKPEMTVRPKKLLRQILKEVDQQQSAYGKILNKSILPTLKEAGIILYKGNNLLKSHRKPVNQYFLSKVLSYLQPVMLTDGQDRVPFLENGFLYFLIKLERFDKTRSIHYALLNIPSESLPRFFRLPDVRSRHYIIYLDDMIRYNLGYVFPGHQVVGCYSIKMNRDADIGIDDEYSGDLVEKIRTQIEKRKVGVPTRFLYDGAMPADMIEFVKQLYQLQEEDLIKGGRYHNLNDFMKFPNPVSPDLEEKPMPALENSDLENQPSILDNIAKQDQILHFPYQSYDYVLRFFNEAAIDPDVSEIKVTLYRVARNSMIGNALISAAKNGKKVTAFVEVKARFDEANNLKWADKMEAAGVRLIYSLPGLKVHAKVALVVRASSGGEQSFAYLGTGNFHEDTARLYCDHGLLTSHNQLTKELSMVFELLETQHKSEPFQHLLVAQHNMQDRFLEMIDREIDHSTQGLPASIVIKLNNIEDQVMIDKLYEASQKGVNIILLVRSICCLVPDAGYSANIKVIRLVDRFLEHARVFYFYNRGKEDLYLASADWMNRNLYRRIEVGFPILDRKIKKELLRILKFQMEDNVKAYRLDSKQHHQPTNRRKVRVRAQMDTYQWLKKRK